MEEIIAADIPFTWTRSCFNLPNSNFLCCAQPATKFCSEQLESTVKPRFLVFGLFILYNLMSSSPQQHIYLKYCISSFPYQIHISFTFFRSVSLSWLYRTMQIMTTVTTHFSPFLHYGFSFYQKIQFTSFLLIFIRRSVRWEVGTKFRTCFNISIKTTRFKFLFY
jgi:hypothetical protein